MRILLTNHYAGTLSYGGAVRPFYLAREWMEQGHEVTIVAASWVHGRGAPPTVSGPMTVEDVDGVRYVWLKTPTYTGNGARRALNMMAFAGQMARFGRRMAEAFKPDVVVSSSNHPLDAVPAHRIARRAGAAYLMEVHDLWPLTPIEIGGISPRHPFIQVLQRAEDYGYRHADRVISMLPNAEDHMRQHGMSAGKFVYIPNGVHVDRWQIDESLLPEDHRAQLSTLAESGRFLVGYAGAHGVANSLDTLLDAAALLRDDPVTFVLLGRGIRKAALEQKAASLGLDNVLFLPIAPKASVPAFLDRMDALYIGLTRTPLFRFGVSPNKLFEYMMAAKPVIYALEAGNDPVAESRCGISPGAENPEAVRDAVRALMTAPEGQRAAMGQRGREYVREHHDYPVLARRFLDAMEAARMAGRVAGSPVGAARVAS